MDLSFKNFLTNTYKSNSQKIRVVSESWFLNNGYCVECLFRLNKFPNNKPVADFYCNNCNEQYELKSKNGKISKKVLDGEYYTMINRINSNDNPNLFIISYNDFFEIKQLVAIPKYFFTEKVIEKRNVAKVKQKNGNLRMWTGCNILFSEIPEIGKIYIIKDGFERNKLDINRDWRYSKEFEIRDLKKRGWTFEILKLIEMQKDIFYLQDIYEYEKDLENIFPENNYIKDKIRQQLQILRDKNYIEFLDRGTYKKIHK